MMSSRAARKKDSSSAKNPHTCCMAAHFDASSSLKNMHACTSFLAYQQRMPKLADDVAAAGAALVLCRAPAAAAAATTTTLWRRHCQLHQQHAQRVQGRLQHEGRPEAVELGHHPADQRPRDAPDTRHASEQPDHPATVVGCHRSCAERLPANARRLLPTSREQPREHHHHPSFHREKDGGARVDLRAGCG